MEERHVARNQLNNMAREIFEWNSNVGWWPEVIDSTKMTEKEFERVKNFMVSSFGMSRTQEIISPLNRNKGELLALMHSELSEALEGVRKNTQDDHLPNRTSLEAELADTVIRILDMAGAYNIDIGGALAEKFEYNKSRADHKLSNRRKKGGKAF